MEFNRYLHGVSDARTRLLSHGLNEESARHEEGTARQSVLYVVLSVSVQFTCFGSVLHIEVVAVHLWLNLRINLLGETFKSLKSL